MATYKETVSAALQHRDIGLGKVEPKLQGIPDELPLSSQSLPQGVLTAREIEITEKYSVIELLDVLRKREIKVEEVTRAFLRRAALAQVATNCLVELMWDQAIERAKYLDSLPEPKGKLFGLPISTKEHHGMVGDNVSTHASFVAWIGKAHGSNLLYDHLYDEGCVFYVRTTQPQTIMHLETISNIYGRTVNPYNRDLTAGGSSGGEGALLGFRGSILGVGGDIGGSVRCPAAHNGIYAFKPTLKRISVMGARSIMVGKETVSSTPGPMTVDRESLELFMEIALSNKPWLIDPSLTAKPWTPFKFDRPLKVAVQWWDGVVQPHPPMTRALKEVAEACRKAGMEVVDWDCEPLDHKKGWEILSALYWPDGGKEALGLMEAAGEPVLPLTKFIIQEQPSVKDLTMHELWELCTKRDDYRAAYARAWSYTSKNDGREVDVILCPPFPGAAAPHDQSRYWGYTSHWNLLDYPAAVFPVTTVDPEKDPKDLNYVPKNEDDKFNYDLYSPEKYANMPINLQIVGRRQYDEKRRDINSIVGTYTIDHIKDSRLLNYVYSGLCFSLSIELLVTPPPVNRCLYPVVCISFSVSSKNSRKVVCPIIRRKKVRRMVMSRMEHRASLIQSQGRTILITGCSDDSLGSALALAMKDRGWRVFPSGRNLAKLSKVKEAGLECIEMDVGSDESVSAAVEKVKQITGGSLDALLNNAGTGYSMPIIHVDIATSHGLFELNVFSIIRVTQAFFPLLLKSTHGALLINNTSASGLLGAGIPFQGTYAASKAAAASVTESLRVELAPFGIRAINLFTGGVKSTFHNNSPDAELPKDSIYNIAKEAIEATMNGNEAGMNKPDAMTWAKQVAGDLSQRKPPYLIFRGGSAGLARLGTLFPTGTFDSTVKQLGGIDVLERKLKEAKSTPKPQ
ncbi:amidase signature domain-containing protein [Fusarium oxysporum Fo47]|uniref:amidase signature domain-containing protein n=1 Tax=Fusarium oxysporum Fo47 TaxID=660027 RepID=UPI0028698468|nr:amidase signature domain-containing protein [Fusarium oxysporum Fo47]WJG37290.1 amidase signature domain-containing protein [Fusarium oxysporum Fo47]